MTYYCPTQETRKKLFEIISVARCLKLGFEEFIGCKKNIQKNLKNPNIFFDYDLNKKHVLFFKLSSINLKENLQKMKTLKYIFLN